MPSIAIGIHVHAEPEQLRATIASVHANTAQPFTLLLLPDGPDRETIAALANFPDLKQLSSERACGTAACFNRLAKNTESEILVFLESGVRVGPNWLVHLLRAIESDPRHGLAGPSTNLSWNEQGVFANAAGSP
jgi:GT2 family glycosyltransferase